jgi:hypothetical protein
MAEGNQLAMIFRTTGADGLIKENNKSYIKAMILRYGNKPASENYQKNGNANVYLNYQNWLPK